jgi:hypothetical protein
MIRRLFTAASAISLAIAITATVFWVSGAAGASLFRGHDGYSDSNYNDPQRWFWREAPGANGPRGVVIGRYTPRWEYDPPGFAARPIRSWRFMGAAFLLHAPDGPYHAWESREAFWRSETSLFIPYWQIILTTAVLPVLYARTTIRCVRRLRHDLGTTQLCRRCGYDLRASSDRCSECGTPITGKLNV